MKKLIAVAMMTALMAGTALADTTLKLVAPARGRCVRARGRVVHAAKLLTVCSAEVFAVDEEGQETLCATFIGTARNIAPPK